MGDWVLKKTETEVLGELWTCRDTGSLGRGEEDRGMVPWQGDLL